MKKSEVFSSICSQASNLLTARNPYFEEPIESLITLRNLCSSLFGPFSPETDYLNLFIDSLPGGSAFVGPLQSGGAQ